MLKSKDDFWYSEINSFYLKEKKKFFVFFLKGAVNTNKLSKVNLWSGDSPKHYTSSR